MADPVHAVVRRHSSVLSETAPNKKMMPRVCADTSSSMLVGRRSKKLELRIISMQKTGIPWVPYTHSPDIPGTAGMLLGMEGLIYQGACFRIIGATSRSLLITKAGLESFRLLTASAKPCAKLSRISRWHGSLNPSGGIGKPTPPCRKKALPEW